LDRYLCCFSPLPSNVVLAFCPKNPSSSSLPSFRWRRKSLSFLPATRGPCPLSPTGIWRCWLKPACSGPEPPSRSPNGSRRTTSRCQIRPRAISSASPRSMNGVSEFQRATSCGPYHTTTGCSYTTSTPTPSRRRPSSPPSMKGSWGSSPTGICESISSARSPSPSLAR
jgi:hypothetical protein